MATESGGSTKPVAVIILGADALVAARPATPIQLWHACLASGYDLAVPATWGDELVAAECLRAVGTHPETVTVMCSCPMVARAVSDGDPDLYPHLVSLVAPPVATARYLRRVYGDRRVHITFVGACPAAGDSAIDAWLTPSELLERFVATAIDVATQPQLFESILPPDRRRHLSQPGGMPTPERVAALPRPRQVVEIDDADVMASIRRLLTSGVRTLVDLAPRLGCACSGAMPGLSSAEARMAVTMLEPPRSLRPVMVDPVGLGLLRRTPPRARPGADARKPEERSTPERGVPFGGAPDDQPTVATSRPASRSPLSWNLRERALPQPPTSGRRSDPSPRGGASSAAWTALDAPLAETGLGGADQPAPRTSSGAPAMDIDVATAAAVRALEAAAKGPGRTDTAASATSAGGRADVPASRTGLSAPDMAGPKAATRDEPPSAPEVSGQSEGTPHTSRATPPGGYWFVVAPSAGASDSQVERDPPSVEESPAPTTGRPAPSDPDGTSPPEVDAQAGEEPATSASEPDGVAPPAVSTPEPPPVEPDREGEPPERGWVVVMLIILLVAGAMLARSIAQQRTFEPAQMSTSATGAARSAHAGAIADVVAVAPAPAPSSMGRVVSSLFEGPSASPARAPVPRPPPPGPFR